MAPPKHILITGATGWLGSRLLLRLLEDGNAIVTVLVRPQTMPRAQALMAPMRALVHGENERLELLEGDITRPRMGLSREVYDDLARRVQVIDHYAGVGAHTAGRRECWRAHVRGTRNLLEFARACRHLEALHALSTVFVAGDYPGRFFEGMLDEGQRLHSPFAASKFEMERMLREAAQGEDRLPIKVFRLGFVVGESHTGVVGRLDGPYYFFRLMRVLRRVPKLIPLAGPGARVYLHVTPTDYAIEAIHRIRRREEGMGLTYCLSDPHPITIQGFCNQVSEIDTGPMFIIPGWYKPLVGLTRLPGGGAVSRLLGVPREIFEHTSYTTTFDNRNTYEMLQGTGIECPPLPAYLKNLWEFYRMEFLSTRLSGHTQTA